MKLPKYIQRKRTKGFKLPENTLCCTRPSRHSNPWKIGSADPVFPLGVIRDNDRLRQIYEWSLGYVADEFLIESGILNYDYLACWCSEDAEYCHVQHSLIPRLKQIMEAA